MKKTVVSDEANQLRRAISETRLTSNQKNYIFIIKLRTINSLFNDISKLTPLYRYAGMALKHLLFLDNCY